MGWGLWCGVGEEWLDQTIYLNRTSKSTPLPPPQSCIPEITTDKKNKNQALECQE
jgi:hypothetical protein